MSLITCVKKSLFFSSSRVGNFVQDGSYVVTNPSWPESPDPLLRLFLAADQHERCQALESDESLLQIIPYVLVMTPDGQYMSYYRQGDEKRLHGHISVGFGGHVQLDLTDFETFKQSLVTECQRELIEEIHCTVEADNLEMIAIIYDSSNAVGRVHVGVVYRAMLDPEQLATVSQECGEISAKYAEDILKEDPENWSKQSLDAVRQYDAFTAAIKDATKHFTGCRYDGKSAFVEPSRDIAAIGIRLLDEVAGSIMFDIWPEARSLTIGNSLTLEEVHSKVREVYDSVQEMLQIAACEGEYSETIIFDVGQALSRSGFFSLPSESRMLFLSYLGMRLLTEIWLGVRRYAHASHEPAEQYSMISRAAGRFMRFALYGEDDATTPVERSVRAAAEAGLSEDEIYALVGKALRAAKE